MKFLLTHVETSRIRRLTVRESYIMCERMDFDSTLDDRVQFNPSDLSNFHRKINMRTIFRGLLASLLLAHTATATTAVPPEGPQCSNTQVDRIWDNPYFKSETLSATSYSVPKWSITTIGSVAVAPKYTNWNL